MRAHVLAQPAGGRVHAAVGAAAHEVEVAREGAARLDVDVDAVEVRLDEREQAGERGGVAGAAVDDLVARHLRVLVVDGAGRGRAADGGGGEGVLPEPEAALAHGVACVRRVHVLRRTRDGQVEVQVEAEDRACDEHDEDGKGCILKVGHLDLHAAKLDAPAGHVVTGARRGRLEAHVLPVCRLQVLKVVGRGEVQG